jgi:hypothetical protein
LLHRRSPLLYLFPRHLQRISISLSGWRIVAKGQKWTLGAASPHDFGYPQIRSLSSLLPGQPRQAAFASFGGSGHERRFGDVRYKSGLPSTPEILRQRQTDA